MCKTHQICYMKGNQGQGQSPSHSHSHSHSHGHGSGSDPNHSQNRPGGSHQSGGMMSQSQGKYRNTIQTASNAYAY